MTEFDFLEHNLVDMIKEEQAKLGYQKESIRFYYPLESLRHFFKEPVSDAAQMERVLADFPAYVSDRLGPVTITQKDGRFCFYIPAQGAEYVHTHKKANEFIESLIEAVGRHATMDEVKQLFADTGKPIHMEPVTNGEFDILISFVDDEDDPYYYCFKDEMGHIIYHRFLPADYQDFQF